MTRVGTINSKDYYKAQARKIDKLVSNFKIEAHRLLNNPVFSEDIASIVIEDYNADINEYTPNFPEIKSWRAVEEAELERDKFYYFSERIIDNLTDLVGAKLNDPESKTNVLKYISNEILFEFDELIEYVDMATGNLIENGKNEEIFIIE